MTRYNHFILFLIGLLSKDAYAVMQAAFKTHEAQSNQLMRHVLDPNGEDREWSKQSFQLSLEAERAIDESVGKFLFNRKDTKE